MALHTVDEEFDLRLLAGASCAFGVFDGLHVGHQYLIGCARDAAEALGARSMVLTFDIDPDEVFHADRLKKLMRNADRIQALERTGVDDVVVLPFTTEFCAQEPEQFLASMFAEGAPAQLHVGEDFRFGARASGTVETLEHWGSVVGCAIRAHHLVSADGKPITATRIRLLLEAGDVEGAAALLGRPYTLRETVQRGRGQGADFGFATANLQVKPHDRVLGEGVYAAYALVDGARYKAAVSVGVSPTFEAQSTANVEVHVLDFKGDLVGSSIGVEFMRYLRPMMKFDTTEELISTVTADIDRVRNGLEL